MKNDFSSPNSHNLHLPHEVKLNYVVVVYKIYVGLYDTQIALI